MPCLVIFLLFKMYIPKYISAASCLLLLAILFYNCKPSNVKNGSVQALIPSPEQDTTAVPLISAGRNGVIRYKNKLVNDDELEMLLTDTILRRWKAGISTPLMTEISYLDSIPNNEKLIILDAISRAKENARNLSEYPN